MGAKSSKILVPVLLFMKTVSISETHDKFSRNEDNCYWNREGCSRLGAMRFNDKFDEGRRKSTKNFQ